MTYELNVKLPRGEFEALRSFINKAGKGIREDLYFETRQSNLDLAQVSVSVHFNPDLSPQLLLSIFKHCSLPASTTFSLLYLTRTTNKELIALN